MGSIRNIFECATNSVAIYASIQYLTLQGPRLATDILQSPRFSVELLKLVRLEGFVETVNIVYIILVNYFKPIYPPHRHI